VANLWCSALTKARAYINARHTHTIRTGSEAVCKQRTWPKGELPVGQDGMGKKNKMAKPAKYTALGSRLGKLFVLDMGGINRAGI